MGFSVNARGLYGIAAVGVGLIMAESLCFLQKALRRSKAMGMDQGKIRRCVRTALVFSIAPAIAILLGILTLSKDLGVPLPWLRLSVVGSLSYETIAATNAENAMGLKFGQTKTLSAGQFATIFFVMTLSILFGVTTITLFAGRLQKKREKFLQRDKKWSAVLQDAMFLGMISAFVGYIFSDFRGVFHGDMRGLIPVLVFLFSLGLMSLCGLLLKKKQITWLGDYALPISLIGGMLFAIPLDAWLR